MGKWNEYTTKSAVEDTDELMIADATANVNKRTPLSILWNWIVNKLTSAVIANLETNSKSVIGALNELNSKGPIRSVIHGETDSEGVFRINIPLDSFWVCSFHDKNTNIGGIIAGTTAFNSSAIYTGIHNDATVKIAGNANTGTEFCTNCSDGEYTITIFKNYSMK